MSVPKRQHVVPKVYLKNFTDLDGRLSLYSKRQQKSLRPMPKDALIKRYYYSQPLNGIENAEHIFETQLLTSIETKYNRLYSSLVTQEGPVDLELMFETLVSMRSRSPAFREPFELGLAGFVDKARLAMPRSTFPPPPEKFPDLWDNLAVAIDPHRSLLAMPHYIREYTSAIIGCSYSVWTVPSGSELATSDNPVVWFEKRRMGLEETVYPLKLTQRTRVVMPLDKAHVLVGRRKQAGEPDFRPGITELSRPMLRQINELQLGCCWDYFVGTAKLSRQGRATYSKKAPEMEITNFDPDTNMFDLKEIRLGNLRTKQKYEYYS